MPTNVYFDTGTTSEQRLYEDLIIEQLKIYGQDVYYLPRKIANKDTIFGEDPASSFDDSYIIEMYVDNVDGYMGEQEIIKKFGLELRDDIVFTLSKLRWETLIKNNSDPSICDARGCQTWNENALLENPKCWFLSDTEERIRSCYTSASNEGVPFCAEFETDAEKNCLIKGEPNPDGTVNCEVFRCKSWNYNDVSEECKNFAWLNETIFEEAQ